MATSPKAAKPGAKPDAEAAAPAAGNSRKKLLIIAGAALLLVGGGGGAWYFLNSSGSQHAGGGTAKAPAPKPSAPPVFLALETFTVNLQSEEAQQFLQVNITLQVADEAQVDLIKTNMPQVRNRLLLLLSGKRGTDILSVEGKKKLATEIMEQIKQPFTPQGPRPEVSDVFFTSFVVQ